MTTINSEIIDKITNYNEQKKENDFKKFLFDNFVPYSYTNRQFSSSEENGIQRKAGLSFLKKQLPKLALISASYFTLDYIFNKYTGTNFKDYVPLINGGRLAETLTFSAYFIGAVNLINKIKLKKIKNIENYLKFSKETSNGYWHVEFKGKKIPEIFTNVMFFDLVKRAKERDLDYSISFVNQNEQLIYIHFKGDKITNTSDNEPALTIISNNEIQKYHIENNIIKRIETIENNIHNPTVSNEIKNIQERFNNSLEYKIKELLEKKYGEIEKYKYKEEFKI